MTRDPHPTEPRLIIDLEALPPDGREFEGELPASVFAMEPGGPQPVSPLRFRLWVRQRDGWLVGTGEVSADFAFECVLCLEPFTDRIALAGYVVEEEVNEKSRVVDLTDRIREDILLALPGHPRCSESSLHPGTCPAAELFQPASAYSPDRPDEGQPSEGSDPWSALDQLDIKPRKGRKQSS
jgi:hypothetical protein